MARGARCAVSWWCVCHDLKSLHEYRPRPRRRAALLKTAALEPGGFAQHRTRAQQRELKAPAAEGSQRRRLDALLQIAVLAAAGAAPLSRAPRCSSSPCCRRRRFATPSRRRGVGTSVILRPPRAASRPCWSLRCGCGRRPPRRRPSRPTEPPAARRPRCPSSAGPPLRGARAPSTAGLLRCRCSRREERLRRPSCGCGCPCSATLRRRTWLQYENGHAPGRGGCSTSACSAARWRSAASTYAAHCLIGSSSRSTTRRRRAARAVLRLALAPRRRRSRRRRRRLDSVGRDPAELAPT